MKSKCWALAGAVCLASASHGATWRFEVSYSNPQGGLMQPGDTATVSLWALFAPHRYAFADAALDIDVENGFGMWTDLTCDLSAPGNHPGDAPGDNIAGILSGQLHSPKDGIFADTSRPILVWHATFETVEFSPRGILLSTQTSAFNLFADADGTRVSGLDTFAEGTGAINVGFWPTPGTASAIGLGAFLIAGRRR